MWLMSGLVPWMSQSRDKAQREWLNSSKGWEIFICVHCTPPLKDVPSYATAQGRCQAAAKAHPRITACKAMLQEQLPTRSLCLSLSFPRCGIDWALANWGTGLIDIDIAAAAPSPSAARVAQTICVQKSNCFVCLVFFANDFNLYSHSYLYLYLN